MFDDSGISASLNRVKSCLDHSLDVKYNKKDSELTQDILRMHGMSKDDFDFIRNTEKMLSSNLADVSIDSNSNKNEVNISGIMTEVASPINKIVGYRSLYRKLSEKYGKEEAKRLSGEMYDMSLALADSTKILIPYCFSIDASKIVISGRDFGMLPSSPAKRLSSYIAALNETVHQLSNHVAGALAIGSFFFDVAHVLIYKEGYTFDNLFDKEVRKYIENCFQSFIHSVNHLSRNSQESPFTNISLFDKVKLATFLSPENMGWYFQPEEGFTLEAWTDYVIKYITEVQNIFTDFFDKGDIINGGRNFRFPVVTANISKHEENGNVELLDKQFIADISKKEVYRYNILVSEGSKVASCCRLLNNFELLELGGQMNSFGGSGISLGSHRVVTINFNRIALEATSYQEYKDILIERIHSSAKILEAHRELIKDLIAIGKQPFMKNGWLRLDRMFSTFGVLGIKEASETLKHKFGVSEDVIADSLTILNDKARELTIQTKNIFNIEQIPGESMAPKFAKIDKILFGEEQVPYEMYANQFVPLWEDVSIYERMQVDGKYNKLFSGGGICHFNLGEKVRSDQAEALIEYAASVGCEHFALNPVYSECCNGHNSFGNYDDCPVCRGKIVEKYSRVVGFLTPITSWNKTRREWEFPKRKFTNI